MKDNEKTKEQLINELKNLRKQVSKLEGIDEELKITNQRYVLASEVALLGIWDWELSSNITTWNERMFEIYGVPKQIPMPYENWQERVHPDDQTKAEHSLRKAIENKTQDDVEFRIVQLDKSIRYIYSSQKAIVDKNNEVVRVLGINIDVSDRKNAEARLKQSEKEYRNLVQGINSIVLKIDHTGVITFINDFGQRLLGFTQNELIGKNLVGTIVHESDSEGRDLKQMIRNIIDNPNDYILNENENICKNGKRIWVSWANKGFFDSDNNLIELLCVGQDITDKKKAEQALKENENYLKVVMDTIQAGIVVIDPQSHKIVDINKKAESMIGLVKGNITGKVCHNFICPADSGKCPITDLGQTVDSSERVLQSPKGDLVILKTVVPVTVGSRQLLLETFIDITQRKQIEEELKEQKERFERLMDSQKERMSFFSHTIEGELVYTSSGLPFLNPSSPDENSGRSWIESFNWTSGSLACMTEHIEKMILDSNYTPPPFEMQYIDVNGGLHFLMVHEYLTFNHKRNEQIIEGIAIDITNRITQDLESQKLWMAVEQSPSSIVITDKEGAIEYVNPAFCATTGYTQIEAKGENPRILKSDQHDDAFYKEMWETLAQGKTWKGEVCNRKKDGDLYWEQATISPVDNYFGEVTHYIAVKHDITYQKEAERMKEDIEQIMRHDLKSPLNGILGFPQLLMRTELTDRQKEFVKHIEIAGKNMEKIIESYLNLVKIEEGTYERNPVPFDVIKTINEILIDLESIVRGKRLEFNFTVNQQPLQENDIISVTGENALCYSMFANILKNAVEASPGNSVVNIEIISKSSDVEIQINNKGTVPEEIKDRFFEKHVTAGKNTGTGLGTYSAKLIAEIQGGSITMQSSEESGTTISIMLPGLRTS